MENRESEKNDREACQYCGEPTSGGSFLNGKPICLKCAAKGRAAGTLLLVAEFKKGRERFIAEKPAHEIIRLINGLIELNEGKGGQ